ncbi:hypothetical protein D3C81_1930770 [compost metagenome]
MAALRQKFGCAVPVLGLQCVDCKYRLRGFGHRRIEVGAIGGAAAQVDVPALRVTSQIGQGEVVVLFGDGKDVLAHLDGTSWIANSYEIDDRIVMAGAVETGIVE